MPVESIVAVIGCQRSGTTLTGQIIGAHPSCVLLDEPDGVYKWFWAEAEQSDGARACFSETLKQAVRKYREPASRFVQSPGGIELSPHVTTLVLKAPKLTFDFEQLQSFPIPVTVVMPVRDPRSVVASMMQLENNDFSGDEARQLGKRGLIARTFDSERRILASAEEPIWIRYATLWKIKSGAASLHRKAGLSVFQFRYEDLIENKYAVVEPMLEHCRLASAIETLRPQTVYVGRGPGHTDRTRPIDQESIETWKICLDENQAAAVMQTAGPLAGSMGYQ